MAGPRSGRLGPGRPARDPGRHGGRASTPPRLESVDDRRGVRSRLRTAAAALVVALVASVGATAPASGAAEAIVTTRNLVIPMSSGGFLRGDLYRAASKSA